MKLMFTRNGFSSFQNTLKLVLSIYIGLQQRRNLKCFRGSHLPGPPEPHFRDGEQEGGVSAIEGKGWEGKGKSTWEIHPTPKP